MVEWIIALSIPALVALLTMAPRWDRAWIFFVSVYLGTFTALAILPWTVSVLAGPMTAENPYMLLVAFFAVTVVLLAGFHRVFCMLCSTGDDIRYWSPLGAIPQRLLIFAGSALFMGSMLLSISAIPLVDGIPGISSIRLQAVGSRILMTGLPADSISCREKTQCLLTSYPRHLNCCGRKMQKQKNASQEKGPQTKKADLSVPRSNSPLETLKRVKKRAKELERRRNRELEAAS